MKNISVRKLEAHEVEVFIELIHLFENVFSMNNFSMPTRDHLQELLQRKDFLVFVAVDDIKVVGGLTAYTLTQYYSTRPLVYIYDLAVHDQWQRKGIGSKLMHAINEFCRSQNVEEVFVQADVADQHAIQFYASTGGIAEEVIHFNYPLDSR